MVFQLNFGRNKLKFCNLYTQVPNHTLRGVRLDVKKPPLPPHLSWTEHVNTITNVCSQTISSYVFLTTGILQYFHKILPINIIQQFHKFLKVIWRQLTMLFQLQEEIHA